MKEVGRSPEFDAAFAAAFPGTRFGEWLAENYEFRQRTRDIERDGFEKVCKRCGASDVWAVLEHAHNVHGDDVPVMGSLVHLTDGEGRYVGGELDQLRSENAELKRQLALRTDKGTPTS